MNKRYQVFVSSTYADLRDERNTVIQTLMEMDCIPSGMELFPAADEDQFDFIKKVIDDCDYYLLIIGARYGSTTSEGISYTEKEYDYAVAKGMKVVALIHSQPDNIAVGKTDKDPELEQRLNEFRAKVQTGRLVKFWTTSTELPGMVALSLSTAIKRYPAVGWVRGNATASTELLEEVNNLRKKNDELQKAVKKMSSELKPQIVDIAGLDVQYKLSGTYKNTYNGQSYSWESDLTFGQMFALIAPALIKVPGESSVADQLGIAILQTQGKKVYSATIEAYYLQTLRIQLQTLGLIKVDFLQSVSGTMVLYWQITEKGEQKMVELRVVRTNTTEVLVNALSGENGA
jgi:hypothetical protein